MQTKEASGTASARNIGCGGRANGFYLPLSWLFHPDIKEASGPEVPLQAFALLTAWASLPKPRCVVNSLIVTQGLERCCAK